MALPTEAEVVQEIQRIAREALEVDRPLDPGEHLGRALDLDSLRLTVLAVELENRFRINLQPEDTVEITTLLELARLVVRRAGKGASC